MSKNISQHLDLITLLPLTVGLVHSFDYGEFQPEIYSSQRRSNLPRQTQSNRQRGQGHSYTARSSRQRDPDANRHSYTPIKRV
jgi:hypothetical protein